MDISNLKNSFSGKAVAIGLSAIIATTPMNSAFAENGNGASAATASHPTITLTQNAPHAAYLWSKKNHGIAVAVLLGTKSRVSPAQIEQILTREIRSAGVRDVEFFYEQNDVAGTGVAYSFGGDSMGPYSLGEARPAAVKATKQYLFQLSHPAIN